ncbi:MAG: molybdopterin adenylyltransferase [Proteobacteria bacterium]|nr:molybdopterin adenylyltransferase [Pseudomonadota bacterium]
MNKFACVVMTISDKGSTGQRKDTSGPILKELLEAKGFAVPFLEIIPDEQPLIEKKLREFSDRGEIALIMTTGGTGPAPRDVTPEATLAVIEKEMPGIAEHLRAESFKKTPHGILSRGRAGIRKKTLIINLPGSPKAVRECVEFLEPVLYHALELVRGEFGEH